MSATSPTGFARRVGSRLRRKLLGGAPASPPRPPAQPAPWSPNVAPRPRDDPFARLIADTPGYAQPFSYYDEIRDRAPIYRHAFGNFITADYAVVDRIFRDPKFGVRSQSEVTSMVSKDSLIKVNPPRHTQLRKLIGQPFHPRLIERYRPHITDLANRLVDPFTGGTDFDAVQDFSLPLAIGVIADILGVPESYQPHFRELGNAVAHSLDPMLTEDQVEAATIASDEINRYFWQTLEERRVKPSDDLLTAFLQATENDLRLTDNELIANAQFTLLAGYATTVGLIGSGVELLVDRPELYQQLRAEPELLTNTIEEMLRYESPVQYTERVALEDAEVAGLEISEGTGVLTMIAAANRDPKIFADPHTFDVHRENANKHLAFTTGTHHCLGSGLSRLEAQIAFQVLLERMPEITRAAPPARRPYLLIRGMNSVPLKVAPNILPRQSS